MGICGKVEEVPEGIPKVAVVYGMEDWLGAGGESVDADFVVRAVSVGQWHGAGGCSVFFANNFLFLLIMG